MTFLTPNAFDISRLDRNDTLDEVPQTKKQKVVAGLLQNKLHKQDFGGSLACGASRVLGPIRRHSVVDISLHMKSVSRASHSGLLVCFVRLLCNGICTARIFHTGNMITPAPMDAQMNLTLLHNNECPRLYKSF